MAKSSIKLTANGPVTNVAKLLGQSGLTTPNVAITSSRLTVVSSNANDTSAGTGVRKVKVFGYNDGSFIVEEVTMNGTTAVTTTASFDFIHDIKIYSTGDNGIEGDITLAVSGGSTVMILKKDYGRTYDGVIEVSRLKYITHIDITGDSTDNNTIYEIAIMSQEGNFNTVLEIIYWNTDLAAHDYNLDNLPVQGLIWVRCKNLKHSGPDNVSVTLHFTDHLNH
jgi:hypothetical protein